MSDYVCVCAKEVREKEQFECHSNMVSFQYINTTIGRRVAC